MKTKIFFAFLFIIVVSLFSNLVFEQMIIKDFNAYVGSVNEDRFHWIRASVEDCYINNTWNMTALDESVHWAMMLGIHIKVQDTSGIEISSANNVMMHLSDNMRRHMADLFDIAAENAMFEPHPLMKNNERIGTLLVHYFPKKQIVEQEVVFKKRTAEFLYMTLVIAGLGSIILAFLFSRLLSNPLTKLKDAAEQIAHGDFSARTASASNDEIGKLSESFNLMAESLQKEDALRKHLMSNVAHELRTPLTIIKAQIEAIFDKIIESNKGLESIRLEVDRLIALIKGIEDITAAEASFFAKLKSIEVNLREFLAGHVGEMSLTFRDKDVTCSLQSHDDIIVLTDDDKLEKVVMNLLSNALKFTERGHVSVMYGIENESFFIEVQDTGQGIPEDVLPHIFDRFYRVDNNRASGLGLGLSIVKELINVMGGKIVVRSKVGDGTTIKVILPRKINPYGASIASDN